MPLKTVPWTLQVGVAIFVMAWVVTIVGWVLQAIEWRRFKRGHSTAAMHGLVLGTRLATTKLSTFEQVRTVSGGRAINHETLLFPLDLPYACSMVNPWRLPWFGRAVLQPDRVRIEARIPLGLIVFVSGWLVMAFTMTAMLVAVGPLLIALSAGVVTLLAGAGYRRTLVREREAADRFMGELERELTNVA